MSFMDLSESVESSKLSKLIRVADVSRVSPSSERMRSGGWQIQGDFGVVAGLD